MTSTPLIDSTFIDGMLQTIVEILGNDMHLILNSYIIDNARKNLSIITDNDSKISKWILEIPRNKPIRFAKSCNKRGAKLIPELSCYTIGIENSCGTFSSSKIELKIKSDDYNLIFREDWDSEAVRKKLRELQPSERVMFRCHFDYGENSEDGEPIYHLNYGGVPAVDEVCWMPSEIRNPRIPFIPIDLVLAIELVVANFYPQNYPLLKRYPDWLNLVYTSEHVLLRPFVDQCARRCNTSVTRRISTKDETVFSSMWLLNTET